MLIGDVDCTAAGKALCTRFGVRAYPTLKSFTSREADGRKYVGGRTLAELTEFVASKLGPGCSVDALALCSDEQRQELAPYIAMADDDRAAQLAELERRLKFAEVKHEGLTINMKRKEADLDRAIETLREAHQQLDRSLVPAGLNSRAFAEQIGRLQALQSKTERVFEEPLLPQRRR